MDTLSQQQTKLIALNTFHTIVSEKSELRINEVGCLLLQTKKTISDISYGCGFETLSYFNRVCIAKNRNYAGSVLKEKSNLI